MRSNRIKRNTSLLFLPSLLLCVILFLAPAFASAEKNVPDEQRSLDSQDPKKNIVQLEAEIDKFKLRVLPLLEGKSTTDATAIFFDQVEALYDVVGQSFKWPWANFYDLYVFGNDNNVKWGPDYYIRGLPNPSEITEEEAIAIAKETVLMITDTSPEALEMYWVNASYYKIIPDSDYSWYIDFVVETPEINRAYYIKFALEIDSKTGDVHSFSDSRSNES